MPTVYDVIVVGAGSAGCALAARLSEDPARSVLLLEAGPWFAGIDEFPPELRYSGYLSAVAPSHPNNWGFVATLRPGVQQPLPRGRVVGGSSAVNGALFTRGLPADFDAWAVDGNDEWSYEKVLPFFRKLETDHDVHDEYHGTTGPVPVRRAARDEWPPVAHAFVAACREEGFPEDTDMNGPRSIGVGALPVNSVDGIRVNTAVAYLHPAADRPNLSVRGNAFVRRIVVRNGRATGVEVDLDGERHTIDGGEIVLSSGAVKSPHLLMLSGIGPPEELRRFDIPVLHESPLVGRQFTDHCTLGLRFRVRKRRNPIPDPKTSAWAHTALHYTTPSTDAHSDMMLIQSSIPSNSTFTSGLSLLGRARMLASTVGSMSPQKLVDQVRYGWSHGITCIIMRGESRGEINLTSADPDGKPELVFNYFEDPLDLARMRFALRLAADLIASEPYRELGAERIVPDDDDLGSDAALDRYLNAHVGTSIHMAGTCRMGVSAETAVVDQHCRVHGVDGLRVVDTSVMPRVVRRCPAATAVMIGERAAALFD